MSIRLRLTLYWAAVLSAVLLIAGVAVSLMFERQQWGGLDGALMEEADTAAETIARSGGGSANEILRGLSEERDLGPGRRTLLMRGGGEIVADFGDSSADLPAIRRKQFARGIVDGDNRVFRYAIVPVVFGGERVYLADGVDATAVRSSIARLRTNLLLLLPLLLAVSVSGGYWLARRALVPINLLTGGLAEIEPRNLSRRLKLGEAKDEVARLTRAINSLLDRVERASMAERRFAADAAHELRTPLTVLRTGLEVALSRERSATEYADALNASLREVVTLCRMADELLTLARLDEEASIDRAPLNLRILVHEVADAVEPLVQAKHFLLTTSLNGDVMVDGNQGHIRRLLINLLDNALKFTPEHGRIAVALEARDGRAIVKIADSGPGIAPADLPLIFERFFRGKERGEPGSGLGLSLCREIARLHGGEVTATNIAGGGSEFVVSLPASTRI